MRFAPLDTIARVRTYERPALRLVLAVIAVAGCLLMTPNPAHALGGAGFVMPTAFDRRPYDSMAAGCAHTLVVQPNGTVSAWGSNSEGQLGNGTTTPRATAALVMVNVTTPLQNVTAVAAGCNFSMALTTDGTVWAWGSNDDGQLGDGSTTDRWSPVQVTRTGPATLDGVRAIAAGDTWSGAVDDDGKLWTWGDNASNQLGRNTGPTDETRAATAKLSCTGADVDNVMQLALGPSVGSAGRETTYLKADGTWWHFGQENACPTQYNLTALATEGIKSVAVGGSYATGGNRYALAGGGDVVVWGLNATSALGRNTTTSVAFNGASPVYAQSSAGTSLANVVAIAAGSGHFVAIDSAGAAWAAGDNTSGATGRNTTSSYTGYMSRMYKAAATNADPQVAVAAGSTFSLTLDARSTVRGAGSNASGELGTGSTGATQSLLLASSSYQPDIAFTAVQATNEGTLLQRSDGTLFAAGSNLDAALGIGVTGANPNPDKFTKLPSTFGGARIRSIGHGSAIGGMFNVLDEQGRNWTWGGNWFSQTGNNSVANPMNAPLQPYLGNTSTTASNVIGTATGGGHSSLLRGDGTAWASGYDRCYGGATMWSGTHRSASIYAPSAPSTAGSATVPNTATLFTSWMSGENFSVGRTTLGKVASCGSNFRAHNRPLGLNGGGDSDFLYGFGTVGSPNGSPGATCTTSTNCNNTTMWNSQSALQVTAGASVSAAVASDGQLWAWGNGVSGEVGNGTSGVDNTFMAPQRPQTSAGVNVDDAISVASGWGSASAVTSSGGFVTWGGSTEAYCRGTNVFSSWAGATSLTNVVGAAHGRWNNTLGKHGNGRLFACGETGSTGVWGRCGAGGISSSWVRPGCAPAAPTTLTRSQALYTTSDTVSLGFQVTDPDAEEYLVPWVQVIPTSSSYSIPTCAEYGATAYRGVQLAAPTAATAYTYGVDITGLPSGSYTWRACAMDMFGNVTSWTNSSGQDFMVDDGLPPAPSTSNVTGAPDSSTQITWTTDASTDAGIGLHTTPYCISLRIAAGAWGGETCYASNVRVESGLAANTLYTARVRVRDLVLHYTTVSSDTAVTTPPASPTLSPTTNHTATSVQFNWTGATGATMHRIEVFTNAGCTTPVGTDPTHDVATPSATFVKSTGITADRAYWYRMRAYSTVSGAWGDPTACTAISGPNGRSTMTVAATGDVSLGSIAPGGTAQGTTTINVTTNNSPGFNLSMSSDGLLRSVSDDIDPIGVGSLVTPVAWSGTGLGFSVVSGQGPEIVSRWGSGTRFAPVPLGSTEFLDTGALATGSEVVHPTVLRFRVDVPTGGSVPDAGSYSMTATVIATPKP